MIKTIALQKTHSRPTAATQEVSSACNAPKPTDETILLTMFIEQLPDLDYINNLPGLGCLVGDMNIHFDNPLQPLTLQTTITLSLYNLEYVINKPTHKCGQMLDCCSTYR